MTKPFIDNMPAHEYHDFEAVRATEIMMLAKGFTEAHVKERRVRPDESTPAMILGTVVHGMVTGHTEEFALADIDGRTKDGKAQRKEIRENQPHAVIINAETFNIATMMAESVMRNPGASEIIENAVLEGSFFWREKVGEKGSTLFKTRPDIVNDYHGIVADLKTAREANFDGFVKAVKYGHYDLQAFTQLRGIHTATDREWWYKFRWIVVEKEPPYMTVVFPFDMTNRTRATWELFAERLALAQKNDTWPGYPETEVAITEDLLY